MLNTISRLFRRFHSFIGELVHKIKNPENIGVFEVF